MKFHRAGLYGEVYETADWIASTLPRKLGNGTNAGGSFRTTTAFGSCNPRGVPVRTRREPRPRHRAAGVGGHSRASDEAQPGGRLRIEGSMRCHGAGRGGGGKLAGAESAAGTAPPPAAEAGQIAARSGGSHSRCR